MSITRAYSVILLLVTVVILSIGVACNNEQESISTKGSVSNTSNQITEMPVSKEKELSKPKQYSGPPAMTIDSEGSYTAVFEMQNGSEFVAELYSKEAPITVNSFVFLARDGYYDGVTFHRVIAGFMAQGGDPTGTGAGGPGYSFKNEFSPIRRHDSPGILSMANRGLVNGEATNGSQFFIMYTNESPRLDGMKTDGSPKDCSSESCHSVFGKVTEGMDVVKGLSNGDVIKSVQIH